LSSGTVRQSASGPTYALTNDNSGNSFSFTTNFPSSNELDTAFPNGNYTITLNTLHNGTKNSTLDLQGNFSFTDPAIQNFAAAQAIDPTNNYTLSWAPLMGGTASDFIQLTIENDSGAALFETASIGKSGALNGLSNPVTIPSLPPLPAPTYPART